LRISRAIPILLVSGILVAGLTACAAPVDDDPKPDKSESVEETPVEETEEAPVATGDFVAASWANPVTDPGELLTSVTGTNFQVDIYQVGTAAATKTGSFANPETNKPIIEVGAELVFVNYIITNTSDEDIPLSYSLVDVTARYADWPYLQGMDSITDFALDEQMNINRAGIAPGSSEAPFIWEPGTSFSYGQNFLYQANSPITFSAGLTPALDNGDLDHDKGQDVKVDTTIK
jgi:hypothetical protein